MNETSDDRSKFRFFARKKKRRGGRREKNKETSGKRERKTELTVLTRARRGEGYHARAVALATETAAPLVSGHGTKRKGGGEGAKRMARFTRRPYLCAPAGDLG